MFRCQQTVPVLEAPVMQTYSLQSNTCFRWREVCKHCEPTGLLRVSVLRLYKVRRGTVATSCWLLMFLTSAKMPK